MAHKWITVVCLEPFLKQRPCPVMVAELNNRCGFESQMTPKGKEERKRGNNKSS